MVEKKEVVSTRDNKREDETREEAKRRVDGGRCEFTSLLTCLLWSDYRLLGTFRAGQWTSHAKPHTFRPVSRRGDVACLDLHTHTNTDTAQTHKYVSMHTPMAGDFLGMQVRTYRGLTSLMTTCPVFKTEVRMSVLVLFGSDWKKGPLERRLGPFLNLMILIDSSGLPRGNLNAWISVGNTKAIKSGMASQTQRQTGPAPNRWPDRYPASRAAVM